VWEVTAYARNLFDKEHIIDAGNTGGSFGIPTFVAGEPRRTSTATSNISPRTAVTNFPCG